MWVTSPGNTIYHLPEVTNFQNTSTFLQQIGSYGPLAIALDSSENPIVAEAINRVAFYFAKLMVRNAFTLYLDQAADARDVGAGGADRQNVPRR